MFNKIIESFYVNGETKFLFIPVKLTELNTYFLCVMSDDEIFFFHEDGSSLDSEILLTRCLKKIKDYYGLEYSFKKDVLFSEIKPGETFESNGRMFIKKLKECRPPEFNAVSLRLDQTIFRYFDENDWVERLN